MRGSATLLVLIFSWSYFAHGMDAEIDFSIPWETISQYFPTGNSFSAYLDYSEDEQSRTQVASIVRKLMKVGGALTHDLAGVGNETEKKRTAQIVSDYDVALGENEQVSAALEKQFDEREEAAKSVTRECMLTLQLFNAACNGQKTAEVVRDQATRVLTTLAISKVLLETHKTSVLPPLLSRNLEKHILAATKTLQSHTQEFTSQLLQNQKE